VESLLGLRREGEKLNFAPLLPADWPGFKMHYRYRDTVYHIAVRRRQVGHDAMVVTLDGHAQKDQTINLVDDRKEHSVEVGVPADG